MSIKLCYDVNTFVLVCVSLYAWVRMYVLARPPACLSVRVSVTVHACMHACMHSCVRACVRASITARICVCVCV